MLKENITAWAIITDDGRLVSFDFPVESNTLLAGIFINKGDADRWLKKIQGQTNFKGSVGKVIIADPKKLEEQEEDTIYGLLEAPLWKVFKMD